VNWFMTAGPEEFLSAAGEFLRAEPARNSVMLTVTADLLAAGGPAGMLYGWWRPDDGPLAAAFMHTPGFPAMLSGMSETAAAALARDLTSAGHRVPGVNAAEHAATAFTDAWRARTGDAAMVHRRMRLFRLDRLVPPATCWPRGSGRSPARSTTTPGTITAPTSTSAWAAAASPSGRTAASRSPSPA
jgi:hypothetical protein